MFFSGPSALEAPLTRSSQLPPEAGAGSLRFRHNLYNRSQRYPQHNNTVSFVQRRNICLNYIQRKTSFHYWRIIRDIRSFFPRTPYANGNQNQVFARIYFKKKRRHLRKIGVFKSQRSLLMLVTFSSAHSASLQPRILPLPASRGSLFQ
jgi:hypothetical protein